MPHFDSMLSSLLGANFNSTADQAMAIGVGKYIPRRLTITNASASLTLAAGGLYTGAGKSGATLIAAAQVYSALTNGTLVLDLTPATLSANMLSAAQLFFALTVPQGSAATGDIYLFGDSLA